jgi:transcriptional enhancer factor
MPGTIVYIDLLGPDSSISVNSPLTCWTSPSQVAEERSLGERGYRIIRATQYPRHLLDIDPTITLISHSMTNARSYFTVHSEDRLIFSESTTLELLDPTTTDVDGILYKTSLVPGLWDTISQSSDASQYTIIQRVVQEASDSSSSRPPRTIFSAIYKFLYQTSTPTEENFCIPHETPVQNCDFSLETLLAMEAAAYPDVMAFAKCSDLFDLDFTIRPDNWDVPYSPNQSVFSSPGHYPQSTSNVVSDEDELLSPASSSFNGIDMLNYL